MTRKQASGVPTKLVGNGSKLVQEKIISMCCLSSWRQKYGEDFGMLNDVASCYNECDMCKKPCDLCYESDPNVSYFLNKENKKKRKAKDKTVKKEEPMVTYRDAVDSMRLYVGTEIVRACPSWRCEGEEEEDGYQVFLAEGYQSWMPCEFFQRVFRDLTEEEKDLMLWKKKWHRRTLIDEL